MAALEGAEDAFATASRHGGGARRAVLPAQGRRPRGRRRGRCSAPASTSSRRCCRASASRSASSTAPTSTSGAAAIRPGTKLVFLESISNPTLEVIDIAAVAELAHAVGAQVIVDNVFATPVFQRSLTLGADVVIYSATKHIDGQGRCLGGVVLGTPRLHPRHARAVPQAHRRRAQPVQRLGDAEGARDARPALPRPGGDRAAARARRCSGHPALDAGDLSRAARPPAGGAGAAADGDRRHHARARPRRRQGGGLPLPRRAADRADLQQPRRRQEPRHPSGHHDPPAADRRAARRRSASATGWCGCRSGSRIRPTCWPIIARALDAALSRNKPVPSRRLHFRSISPLLVVLQARSAARIAGMQSFQFGRDGPCSWTPAVQIEERTP